MFTPRATDRERLRAGEVGYLIASIKEIDAAPVGDTIVDAARPDAPPLPGLQADSAARLRGPFSDQLRRLRELSARRCRSCALNDASLSFEPEVSAALGFGFRCGFLGLLHMEIIQERLEREHGLELISTAPTVVYEVEYTDGEVIKVENPAQLPESRKISEIREPIILASILVPQQYLGRRDSALHREARRAAAAAVSRQARSRSSSSCRSPKSCSISSIG